MTTQIMFEQAQELFPKMGFTEFLGRVNRAYKQFTSRTRCLLGVVNVTVVASTIEYDIPANMNDVKKIRLLDSGDKPITTDIKYKIDSRVIRFTDRLGRALVAMPTTAAKIELWGTYIPANLTAIDQEPEMKSDFHDALVSQVIMEKLAAAKDYQGAQFYRTMVKEREKDAKIYAASEGDGGSINPDLGWF